jgi:hypothetical protein
MNDRRLEFEVPIPLPSCEATGSLCDEGGRGSLDPTAERIPLRKGDFGIPQNKLDAHQFISFY